MSLNIGDNFSYLGKKFLDARESFETVALMKACVDVPEGFITYCKEDKKRYEFKDNTWVEYVTTGTGGTGMTDEEREQLASKFDDVTTETVTDEEDNEMTQLTFYSNGAEVKSVQFTGGGGGGNKGGTLTTTLAEYTTIGEGDKVNIPYTFTSPNFGEAKLYVSIVNGEATRDLEYPILRQGGGNVALGTLNKGINYITMYAVDALAQMTNTVNITIVCGALEISSTFDDGQDYSVYSSISIPFTISALDPNDIMTLNVDIDGTVYSREVYNGFNTYTFPNDLKTVGVHTVSMQVIGTGFQSNILTYRIIITDNTHILLSTISTDVEVEEGYNVSIDYRVSTTNVASYVAKYYVNGDLYSTAKVNVGTNTFTGSFRDFPQGEYSLGIEVSSEDGLMKSTLNINVKVVPNSFQRIEHAKIGLQAYFDMSTKSNSDPDRDTITSLVATDLGKYPKLILHDYNYATNGWIDGRLVSNGKAWAEMIDYLPLEDDVLGGFTFDILFTSNNMGDNYAKVIECTGADTPYMGFYIDSEKAVMTTEVNQIKSYYTDRQDMRITFVVNRTSTYYEEYIIDPETGFSIKNPNPTYKPNPMIQTFVNGIFTEVAMLSDTGSGNNKIYEHIQNSSQLYINTDKNQTSFGNSAIKSIRIYNRPLDHEEVLQNYMADYDDLMEQKAIYDKNYVTIDQDLPTLNFYDTEIGKCDLMTKDTKQWINIVYTSPNPKLFGDSFNLMGQTAWQGTSSLAYPTKNYKFKLYDWARDEDGNIIEESKWDSKTYTKKKINMYPNDNNGHKENTFCLKADYMDSSHCRNTGTARLVNDFLFDGHPNPAKQIDPTTRDTINGFPCNLYINGQWMGIFNFNHDKSCTKTLGMETIPNTVRWEIKANSDSSAGAFIKTWTNVEECYKAILTDFEIVYDEDAFEDKTGEFDLTKYYDELGFEIPSDGELIEIPNTWGELGDGSINGNNGANEDTWSGKRTDYYIEVSQSTYQIRVDCTQGKFVACYGYDQDKNYVEGVTGKALTPITYKPSPNVKYIRLRIDDTNATISQVHISKMGVKGSYYDYAILSLARFVNFVSGADEETWQAHISEYCDVEQACRYYLNVMTMGMIDNFAKNCIINMYGDDIWWFSFYDMDSSLGLDNTGYNKFDSNIEPSHEGVYNCSTSRMWVKLNEYSQKELFNTFKKIREGKYTYENICKYLIEKQIDVIPQLLYNKDMYKKYISQGRQYLHMLHGNNKDHLKRWLYNRFQYVDSLFLQHNSPYTKQSVTIRSCKPTNAVPKTDSEGNIISQYTARFEIQTYVPQYVTVCWRKNTFETKRVDWNETVVFENDMVNSQDNELIVYCATNIKHLGDCSNLNPTSIDIGNASRLIEFVCEDSDKLVKADLSKNNFLKRASFNNCSVMGTASGGSNVLDVTGCTNLKELDIRGTQITSVLTNTEGGNLERILYPEAIQNVVLSNQTNLEVVGLPYEPDNDIYAQNLSSVTILGCQNIKSLSYPYIEGEPVNFDSLRYVQNLTLSDSIPSLTKLSFDGFSKLRNINVYTMPQITDITFTDLLPANEVSTFKTLKLANIPQVDSIAFNVTSDDYKIAFADGAEANLGGLTSCRTIESNYSIKGLNKLIVPITLKELKFTSEYGDGVNDITNIWSHTAVHENDGFTGLDFKDMSIEYINMLGLSKVTNGINFNIAPISQHPNLNITKDGSETKPYFRPTGKINLDNYVGDMTGLLKGIDLSKFIVEINTDREQTELTSLFEDTIGCNTDKINRILAKFPNSVTWSYLLKGSDISNPITIPTDRPMVLTGMYKDSSVTTDTDLPTNVMNVSEMYMNCTNTTELPYKNWEKTYDDTIVTTDCYKGSGVDLDEVPTTWGGYGFSKDKTVIAELTIPSDNYTIKLGQCYVDNNAPYKGTWITSFGDGNYDYSDTSNTGMISHTYEKAGTYILKTHRLLYQIDTPTRQAFTKIINVHKYLDVWGITEHCIAFTNLIEADLSNLAGIQFNAKGMFQGCSKLTKVIAPNFTPTNCTNMFSNCTLLTEIIGADTWNMSNCTSTSSMFKNCSSLTELVGLETWDMSNCTNINSMFNSSGITNTDFMSTWDLSKATASSVVDSTPVTNIDGLLSRTSNTWSTVDGSFADLPNLTGTVDLTTLYKKVSEWTNVVQACPNVTEVIAPIKGSVYYSFHQGNNSLNTVKIINETPKELAIGDYFLPSWKVKNLTFENTTITNMTNNTRIDQSSLTVDSLLSLFNALKDYSIEGGTYTCTIGSTNLAKLTDEQKAIATNKGWTLA